MEHKLDTKNNVEEERYTEKLKKIGLPSVVILGISALTGAGIYSLLGHATEIAGPAVIISLLIGAIFAFIVSSFYSELVSIKPLNGGGFIFIKEAYGQKGLYLGWLTWLANMAYGALVAHTTASFVVILFGIDPIFIQPIAIGFILLMAGVNIGGSKFLSRVQIPLTFALLISLIIGSIYLLVNPDPSISWSLDYFFAKDLFSIIPAAAILFVVFIGFEDICTIANETENPRKNIPRAYYIILFIATIVYLLVLVSLYYSTHISQIIQSEIAILDAVSQNFIVYFIVLLGAIFSLMATLGVSLMAQSRNLVGLSINDFTDRKYAKIDEDANAPTKAIKLSAFITILILLSGQVEFYASITIISYMCVVTGLALTVFKYRKTKEYDEDTFKVPLHPFSTIIGLILCGLLIITIELMVILVPIIWLLIGLIVYLFFSSKRRVYGTIFLVTAFLFTLTEIYLGFIIIAVGIAIYLVSIADRYSIIFTLAGIKFVAILIVSFLLYFVGYFVQITSPIPNLDVIFSEILIKIFAIFIISSFITVVFDIVHVREIVNYFVKKREPEEVAIELGEGKIIETSKSEKTIIFILNIIIAGVQIIASFIAFLFSILIALDLISIQEIGLFDIILTGVVFEFIFIVILLLFGICTLFSGVIKLYVDFEEMKLKI